MNSITIDTSAVTVGSPTVNGDTATVPVSGTMKMTFDKEKLRPIIKQMMEAQGGGVQLTDDQIDALPRPDGRRRPGRAAQREPDPQAGGRRLEDLRAVERQRRGRAERLRRLLTAVAQRPDGADFS